MLEEIQLENFKCFGERVKIPLAPITLIFGPNSSGKSAIIQALQLMKQSIGSGSPLKPKSDEPGGVDLGSFQELLFEHNLRRTLVIHFRVASLIKGCPNLWMRGDSSRRGFSLEYSFKRPSSDENVSLRRISLGLGESDEIFASFGVKGRSEVSDKSLRCTYLDMHNRYWEQIYDAFNTQEHREYQKRMLEAFRRDVTGLWEDYEPDYGDHDIFEVMHLLGYQELRWPDIRDEEPNEDGEFEICEHNWKRFEEHVAEVLQRLDRAMDFYSSPFSMEAFTARLSEYFAGFRIVPSEGLGSESVARDGRFLPELLKRELGIFFLYHSSRTPGTLCVAPDYLPEYADGLSNSATDSAAPGSKQTHEWDDMWDLKALMESSAEQLRNILRTMWHIGPIRPTPERLFRFTWTSPSGISIVSRWPELLYREPSLTDQVNNWLDRLDIGYSLKIDRVAPDRDIFEVRLIDRKGPEDMEVSFSDVGFGISQVLPLVVIAVAAEWRLLCIEQPELHVHPGLQAYIADLFVESMQKRKNRFVIETHSEYLILETQKLIRKKKLKAEDVSVLYVQRGEKGSTVQRLRLDEEGEFIDDWPGGFFPERLRLLDW